MKPEVAAGIFKPTLSKAETRNDLATRVAKGIVEKETAARNAKTERLRKARVARDDTA